MNHLAYSLSLSVKERALRARARTRARARLVGLGGVVVIWMFISSIVAALIGLGVYIYFLNRGQFDDDEEIKYQLFREDNPDERT